MAGKWAIAARPSGACCAVLRTALLSLGHRRGADAQWRR